MADKLFLPDRQVLLGYGAFATTDILGNLSGIAAAGDSLWTVSDEGRTVECLKRDGAGHAIAQQVNLDTLIADIPGIKPGKKNSELDLESIDIANGKLWLCGSHCRVRKKPETDGELNPRIVDRPSRHFLACCELSNGGVGLKSARALPFEGAGSLRAVLSDDPFLQPFIDLPSKENGLDIEGILARDDGVMLGLRGPLIDSVAVVVHLSISDKLKIRDCRLSFLDLGGLAIRDLARADDKVLALAGPMDDVPGPFKLYEWTPAATAQVQSARPLCAWPESREKPEGICALTLDGAPGFVVVYDHPSAQRIEGQTFKADWIARASL